MNSIKIIANGSYLPKYKLENKELNKKYNLEEGWIEKRSGIKTRYYALDETIEEMATKAAINTIKKTKIDIKKIGAIIVATTSTDKLMPGISYIVQENLDIKNCMCFDILAGCSGYINAFDIARKYIIAEEIEYGLIVGVEKISKYIDDKDIGTKILLGDGAGATLIGKASKEKVYEKNIESFGQEGEILTCDNNSKLYMNGKEIYKFGITKTVENIQKLLKKSNTSIEDIKYIVPHQSNLRIIENMAKKLNIKKEKIYINIQRIGNTFNASIPIALEELTKSNQIKENDKIILIGYGGGLNLGSILLEF